MQNSLDGVPVSLVLIAVTGVRLVSEINIRDHRNRTEKFRSSEADRLTTNGINQ